MKTRIISAIIALLIVIPIVYYGGNVYFIAACLIGLIGFSELLKLKKDVPLAMKCLSLISFILILTNNIVTIPFFMNIEEKLILLVIINVVPIIYYYKSKKYTVEDAMFLIGCEVFLGLSFNSLISTRLIGLNMFIVLLSITIVTDSFALFGGKMFGKHKLSPNVSPNKTIEGFIIGSVFGTLVSTILYVVLIRNNSNIIYITLLMFFLSVVGQIGDLVFSAIKRNYSIKDFGNIMPGHGGVLDRLDSILFVMIVFSYISRFM